MKITQYLTQLIKCDLKTFLMREIRGTVDVKTSRDAQILDFKFTCLTDWLTPWRRVIQNLTVTRPVKKFLAFYGTRWFIAEFTTAHHWHLSWNYFIPFAPSHHISTGSILILYFHLRLRLPSGPFPLGLTTKTLYSLLIFPMRAICLAHLIHLDVITLIWWSVRDTKLLI
jgi:hypothetical protein